MRRFARVLFTIGSAVSLILLLATCALWVRSHWQRDSWVEWVTTPTSAHRGQMRTRHVFWDRGRLYVEWMTTGVMVRELQHGNHPGPFPLLEPSERSEWSHDPPEGGPVDLAFEYYRNERPRGATTRIRGLGLRVERLNWPSPTDGRWEVGWDVTVPFWMLAVVLGVMPAALTMSLRRRRLRRRRQAAGQCVRCGYDRRASPGLCPECGAATVQ